MGTECVFVYRKPSGLGRKKSLQGSIVIGTSARNRDYKEHTECSLQSLAEGWEGSFIKYNGFGIKGLKAKTSQEYTCDTKFFADLKIQPYNHADDFSDRFDGSNIDNFLLMRLDIKPTDKRINYN